MGPLGSQAAKMTIAQIRKTEFGWPHKPKDLPKTDVFIAFGQTDFGQIIYPWMDQNDPITSDGIDQFLSAAHFYADQARFPWSLSLYFFLSGTGQNQHTQDPEEETVDGFSHN